MGASSGSAEPASTISGTSRLRSPQRACGLHRGLLIRSSAQAHEDRAELVPSSDGGEGVVNILIVDDEPKNLTVLETVLDSPRNRVIRAESADKALLALLRQDFAVLILDVQMPGITGFELAQMIKERKKTSEVPIIFLTAYYNEDQHVIEGYDSGAVELSTNTVKYGALSGKPGRIEIAWEIDSNSANPVFSIRWTEHDGPPVVAPTHQGFGTTVVTKMVEMSLDGETVLEYSSTGLIWKLACPLKNVLEGMPT
jgi:CheY-like chemotaxis protein